MANTKIPKKIHQIWIGNAPIPEHCEAFAREMQEMHPDWEYKLWTVLMWQQWKMNLQFRI